MWQTKYALAVPKNLGLGLKDFSSLGVRSAVAFGIVTKT